MRSPLITEQSFSARLIQPNPRENPSRGRLPSIAALLGCLFLTLVVPGAVYAQPSGEVAVDNGTLCQVNWKTNLGDLLAELVRRSGGNPWPSSTINDAPMALLQATYMQMGGDSSLLDFNETPPIFYDLILTEVYLAVDGSSYVPGSDDSIDIREEAIWQFFLDFGGGAVTEG